MAFSPIDGGEDLVLTVDGQKLTGWSEIAVTRGIEQMPNTFDITATEGSPVARDARGIKEGSACTVALGEDKVITGYVDVVIPSISNGEHTVRLIGRGKCCDLVDCSAEWKGCQISGSSVQEIAAKLAAPYGITVTAPNGPGIVVPQFNINVTDTPADILELITRHSSLLYYEDPEGNLVLNDLAPDDMATGFQEGVNVQQAALIRSAAQRYSNYRCALLTVDTSGLLEYSDGLFYFDAPDPNVGRHRQLVIVAEGVVGGNELAKARAQWEGSRRAGRGRTVNVTVDSWRDEAGRLWTPNTCAPVDLPTLGLTGAVYCIASVTHRLGLEGGRRCDVTLMGREAFIPAPIRLQPVIGGLVGADGTVASGGGNAG